ncbi:MAG TPA: hypothetical protein VMG61_13400 [Usitatibacter sp.]|nr:hypothetical protein [Usitatibacter sp.]
MEDNKPVKAGEALTPEQVTDVAGGQSVTTTVSTTGIGVTANQPGTDVGTALTNIYEGFVDVTSHIIERVVNSVKN